jgi:hypothetical protein
MTALTVSLIFIGITAGVSAVQIVQRQPAAVQRPGRGRR